jgi:hypothetical protein
MMAQKPQNRAVWQGVAVVALEGTTDATWPLAQAVYQNKGLRPSYFHDSDARILAGEPAGPKASAKQRELQELREAVHGDDTPSRGILSSLAHQMHVKAILVVFKAANGVEVRAFDPQSRHFLAVRWGATGPGVAGWNEAVKDFQQRWGSVVPKEVPPTSVSVSSKQPSDGKSSIFTSGWFWGAVVFAAAAGVTVYLVSRNPSTDSGVPLKATVQRLNKLSPSAVVMFFNTRVVYKSLALVPLESCFRLRCCSRTMYVSNCRLL